MDQKLETSALVKSSPLTNIDVERKSRLFVSNYVANTIQSCSGA